jgi:hypothetical protein
LAKTPGSSAGRLLFALFDSRLPDHSFLHFSRSRPPLAIEIYASWLSLLWLLTALKAAAQFFLSRDIFEAARSLSILQPQKHPSEVVRELYSSNASFIDANLFLVIFSYVELIGILPFAFVLKLQVLVSGPLLEPAI